MEITIVALVNGYRTDEATGKLDVLGLYNDLYTPVVPIRLSGMQLMVRLAIYPDDFGKSYSIRAKIYDEDGNLVGDSSADFIATGHSQKRTLFDNRFITLAPFLIPNYGGYDIQVCLNEVCEIAYPFWVARQRDPSS